MSEPVEVVEKTKIRYDRALLDKVLERDGATLVGSEAYEKLNRETKIKFLCKCGEGGERGFRYCNENGGCFCEKCKKNNSLNKMKKSCLDKFGVENPGQAKEVREKMKKTCLDKFGVEHNFKSKEIREKRDNTFIQKYGVKHPSQSNEVKEKTKITCKQKYGVEYTLHVKEVRDKGKETLIEKYGAEHISQTEHFKEKYKETSLERYRVINPSQINEIKEKKKKTCLEHFGVENPGQAKEVREKMKKTCLDKFGVENPGQSKEVREKVAQTNLERYGNICSLHGEEIKEKVKQTNLERYEVEFVTQNQDIFEKAQKNAKKFKEFKMPSGTVRKVQGYEPFALRDLLKTYTEEQIKTDRKEVGRIKYKAECCEKEKYYFPDIYLPHEKKYIEVKSSWTAKQNPELIEAKANACREQGYACEIWVYDAKGERV